MSQDRVSKSCHKIACQNCVLESYLNFYHFKSDFWFVSFWSYFGRFWVCVGVSRGNFECLITIIRFEMILFNEVQTYLKFIFNAFWDEWSGSSFHAFLDYPPYALEIAQSKFIRQQQKNLKKSCYSMEKLKNVPCGIIREKYQNVFVRFPGYQGRTDLHLSTKKS